LNQPETTTMPVHRATANDRTSAKETAALDRLAARLPNGGTAAALDLVRDFAYALGNATARRWCQQLVRDARKLPAPPKRADGNRFDGDGVAPADLPAEAFMSGALVDLWGDCEALLRARDGLWNAASTPPPGRELAPVRTEPMQRVPAEDRFRAHYNDVAAMTRWAAEHDDSAPGWMDRAAAALDAERRTAGLVGPDDDTEMVVLEGDRRTGGGAR
jgi:hypothetical protein